MTTHNQTQKAIMQTTTQQLTVNARVRINNTELQCHNDTGVIVRISPCPNDVWPVDVRLDTPNVFYGVVVPFEFDELVLLDTETN